MTMGIHPHSLPPAARAQIPGRMNRLLIRTAPLRCQVIPLISCQGLPDSAAPVRPPTIRAMSPRAIHVPPPAGLRRS